MLIFVPSTLIFSIDDLTASALPVESVLIIKLTVTNWPSWTFWVKSSSDVILFAFLVSSSFANFLAVEMSFVNFSSSSATN